MVAGGGGPSEVGRSNRGRVLCQVCDGVGNDFGLRREADKVIEVVLSFGCGGRI